MKLKLVDGSWDVQIYLDRSEPGCNDNVFLSITEDTPEQWRLLRANQITIGITAADARKLAQQLMAVAEQDEMAANEATARGTGKNSISSNRKRRPHPPAPFTPKQGKYLAFIQHYMTKFGCSPAEADIQRHFLVSAPTINSMIQRLEHLGLIARTPGQARSIRLLVPPELLPPL